MEDMLCNLYAKRGNVAHQIDAAFVRILQCCKLLIIKHLQPTHPPDSQLINNQYITLASFAKKQRIVL